MFHELLSRDELNLAIEFICDKIFEHNLVISEYLGKILQVVSAKLGIIPRRSWGLLVIEESESHQLKRLYPLLLDLEAPAREVFDKVRKYIEPEGAAQIDEFFTVGELELAVEDLVYCLINYKIPVSEKDVDKLRSIWLDIYRDPSEWVGFNIQEES